MITSLVKFILLESEMKGMSIQIRKCNFFWEELQKYSLAPQTLFHQMPNNLREEKTSPRNLAICVCFHLVRGLQDLKDAAQRIRYMRRVRWVKGGGRRESESKNWMAR